MLTKILAISGKPGLFKLISGNKRMLIVESLVDGKRGPVYGNEQINALSDIAMYTEEEEVALSEVFAAIQQKEGKNPSDMMKSPIYNLGISKPFVVLSIFESKRKTWQNSMT